MTETPIYDQISREFETGTALAAPPAHSRVMTQHAAGRSHGEGRRPVSVWALLDEYHAHRR